MALMIFLILFSYVLGSIPTGYMMGKALKGVDIRRVGSGNPGATNVFRSVGKTAGIVTLVIDMVKGWAPVFLALHFTQGDTVPLLCGLMAVVGHTWSVFLNFNGGKGVATSAGVFWALLPLPTAAAFAAFGLGVAISKHISIGSLAGAVVLGPVALLTNAPSDRSILALGLGLLIVIRHIPNIKRLWRGEEISFMARPPEPPAS